MKDTKDILTPITLPDLQEAEREQTAIVEAGRTAGLLVVDSRGAVARVVIDNIEMQAQAKVFQADEVRPRIKAVAARWEKVKKAAHGTWKAIVEMETDEAEPLKVLDKMITDADGKFIDSQKRIAAAREAAANEQLRREERNRRAMLVFGEAQYSETLVDTILVTVADLEKHTQAGPVAAADAHMADCVAAAREAIADAARNRALAEAQMLEDMGESGAAEAHLAVSAAEELAAPEVEEEYIPPPQVHVAAEVAKVDGVRARSMRWKGEIVSLREWLQYIAANPSEVAYFCDNPQVRAALITALNKRVTQLKREDLDMPGVRGVSYYV